MTTGMGCLAILGGGGHGRVVGDCALAAGWREIAFFDDGLPTGAATGPWQIAGNRQALQATHATFEGFIVAFGDNAMRWRMYCLLLDSGKGAPATIVHPRANVSAHATLGPGSIVVAGAIVNIGARIGAAAIINTGASVDHDCVLDNGVHISPGARLAGSVRVGQGSWIGAGAVIREGVTIGAGAVIGAGAIVLKPVPDGATVVGNPARILKRSIS